MKFHSKHSASSDISCDYFNSLLLERVLCEEGEIYHHCSKKYISDESLVFLLEKTTYSETNVYQHCL